MGLGTLTIQHPDGPLREGHRLKEDWLFQNADNTRGTDYVTAKWLTRIDSAIYNNVDNYNAASDKPLTIDNTVFPPRVKVNNIAQHDSGYITLKGV